MDYNNAFILFYFLWIVYKLVQPFVNSRFAV